MVFDLGGNPSLRRALTPRGALVLAAAIQVEDEDAAAKVVIVA